MPLVALDIARLLRELAATLRAVLDRRIDIQLDLPAGPLWFDCEREPVEDAIVDLVRLARNAIDGDGVITLSAQRARGGTARAPLRLLLRVACSAWQEEMPHSDVASRLARAHGATLTVAGTPGHGTVVTLSLPAAVAESAWAQRERRQLRG
jgi:signal transduction histidine kinase